MVSFLMLRRMPSPRICRGRLLRRAALRLRRFPFSPTWSRSPTAVPASGFTRTVPCHPRSFCSLLRPSSIPAVVTPIWASIAPISQFPTLCFQSLAHSSAIRWGWGCASPLATRHSPLPRQERNLSTSVSPFLAILTKSSILRIPQLLCLPLLRKLPGCQNSLPNLEPAPRHPLCESQPPASPPTRSRRLRVVSFPFSLPLHSTPPLPSFRPTGEISPRSFHPLSPSSKVLHA